MKLTAVFTVFAAVATAATTSEDMRNNEGMMVRDTMNQAAASYGEHMCRNEDKTKCGHKCVDTSNDPENCGQCGFHCPSGSCTNGVCSTDSCAGSVCGAFVPCGPGGSCACASTSSGEGFCVNGDTPCAGLADCGSNLDCPFGSVCIVGSCCDRNVCVGTDFCGGITETSKRDWVGSTIADRGTWVSDDGTAKLG